MSTEILFDIKGNLGVITLNRPDKLNAINWDMIRAMTQQLKAWESNDTVKAVLVKGAGDKAFCAGGDVKALYHAKKEGHEAEFPKFYGDEYRLNHAISVYPKPYISMLDGITMGGGAGISIHGKYRIGTEKLIFAMPETTIGFFPDVGGGYFLSRLDEGVGLYLGLTGEKIGLADAESFGLTTHSIKSDDVEALTDQLATAKWDDENCLDEIIDEFDSPEVTPSTLKPHLSVIGECFKGNNTNAIIAALNNHSDVWAQETAKLLMKKSPISVCVAHQQIERAKEMDLKSVLQMEYTLCHHFMKNTDFFEGIRSLLVDKDRNPQWKFETIDAVSPDYVNDYFNTPEGLERIL